MDEAYALTAVRYVELNPVKARLAVRAQDWPWSSASCHMNGTPDGLTAAIDYLANLPDRARYLADGLSREEEARLGYFTDPGFPMGAPAWLSAMETKSSRNLRPRPRGRPRLDTD